MSYIDPVIAKLGPLVSAVAGSIGGTTFQRNGPSAIVRSKPLPVHRQSPFAGGARQQVKSANQVWMALTLSERNAWEIFAATQTFYNRFGDVIPSTGYLAFSRAHFGFYGSAAHWQPHAINVAPPSTTASTLPVNPVVLLESGGLDMSFQSDDLSIPFDSDWAIFATRPRRPTTPPDKPTVSDGMLVVYGGPGTGLPIDLTHPYITCYGRLPIPNNGEGCTVSVHALATGSMYPGLIARMGATPI